MKPSPGMAEVEKVVFVCGDCDDGPALRKWLKKRLQKEAPDADVKVVRTGCMGICPDDKVSACIAGARPSTAVWRVDPDCRESRRALALAVLDQD